MTSKGKFDLRSIAFVSLLSRLPVVKLVILATKFTAESREIFSSPKLFCAFLMVRNITPVHSRGLTCILGSNIKFSLEKFMLTFGLLKYLMFVLLEHVMQPTGTSVASV